MIVRTEPFLLDLDGVPVLVLAPLRRSEVAQSLADRPTHATSLEHAPISKAFVKVQRTLAGELVTVLEGEFGLVEPERTFGLVDLSVLVAGQYLVSGYVDVDGRTEPFVLTTIDHPGVAPSPSSVPLSDMLGRLRNVLS